MLNNIDLNKLRIFEAVIREGNYSKASLALGLTRSAISQAITALEVQIGFPLFHRQGKVLIPTEKAKQLSPLLSESFLQISQIINTLGEKSETHNETVRIGSYLEYGKIHLAPVLRRFLAQYPEAKFKIIFDSPSRLEELLAIDKVDMTFSIFPQTTRKSISNKKILSQELVLVAAKKYAKKCEDPSHFISLPHIDYFSTHRVLPKWYRLHFKRKNLKKAPQIFAGSAEMLLKMCHLEMGVGVVPLYLAKNVDYDNISIVRPTNKKLEDSIWLNQKNQKFSNSTHEAFFNFVIDRSKYF